MTNTIGRLRTVGIGREATRGTGVASNYWLRTTSFDEGRESEHVLDESAIGNTAESSGVNTSKTMANPSISAYLDLAPQGLIEFANAESYAVSANADVSGNVYDHVFKVGSATMGNKSLTINTDDPTFTDQRFVNAILDSISMNFNVNERVNLDMNFVSEYPTDVAATPAIVAPQYFMGRHVTVSLDTAVSEFDSGSVFGATSVTFERTNNVDTGDDTAFELGKQSITNHIMQSRNATLTINKVQNNKNFVNFDLNADFRALKIHIVDTATTIGTAANPSYTVTFPKVSIKTDTGGDNNTRRTESITFQAHYGLDDVESASYLYKVEMTNLVPTYLTI